MIEFSHCIWKCMDLGFTSSLLQLSSYTWSIMHDGPTLSDPLRKHTTVPFNCDQNSFEPIFHWMRTYLMFTCASQKCFTAQAGIILSPYRLLWLFIEVASKKKNILPAKRAQERLLGESGERRETTDLLTSISRDWDCERIVIRLAWSGATLNVHTLGIFPLFPRRSWRRDSPMVMAFSFVGKWVAKWFRYMECILVGGDCEKWK